MSPGLCVLVAHNTGSLVSAYLQPSSPLTSTMSSSSTVTASRQAAALRRIAKDPGSIFGIFFWGGVRVGKFGMSKHPKQGR